MSRLLVALVAAVGLCAPAAAAGPLSVRVVDSAGRPVRDAVVTVRPAGTAPRRPASPGKYVVTQKDLQFHPFVMVVPQGALVSFPNLDPMQHHVYSFSEAKRFELKLFAKDQSRSVRFDKPGVVAVGCNIHDRMTAFVVVTDSVWTSKTNAQGYAIFNSAPAVAAKVSVWHPFLRASGNLLAKQIGAGNRNERFVVTLRAPPMAMGSY